MFFDWPTRGAIASAQRTPHGAFTPLPSHRSVRVTFPKRMMPCHFQAGTLSRGIQTKLNSRGRLQARRKKQAAKRAAK